MVTMACLLGFHKWKYTDKEYTSYAKRKCYQCGKNQIQQYDGIEIYWKGQDL